MTTTHRDHRGRGPAWRATRVAAGTALLGLSLHPRAFADSAATDVRRLFPFRAAVSVTAAGPGRIELPVRALAETSRDRSDLRVIDAVGRTIPCGLSPAHEAASTIRRDHLELVAVDRRHGPAPGRRAVGEHLTYEVPTPPSAFDALELSLPGVAPFVARVTVTGRGDGGEIALATSEAVFRLPADAAGHGATRARIPIRPVPVSSLELDVEIQEGSWLSPSAVLGVRGRATEPAEGELALVTRSVGLHDGAYHHRVEVPPSLGAQALRVATSTPAFLRRATVRVADGQELGRGVVARLSPAAPPPRLDLERAIGGVLELSIEDVGEGPLEDLAVSALVPLPELVCEPLGDGALHVYWGGQRIGRASPRTVASLRGHLEPARRMDGAPLARWLEALPVFPVAPPEPNPLFDAGPALAFALRPGAPLDPTGWALERTLEAPSSSEGLVVWRLSAEDLARLQPDLGDLRIVDSDDRQRPFLTREVGLALPVPVRPSTRSPAGAGTGGGRSRFDLELPAAPLAVRRITLAVDEEFVDRQAEVRGRLAATDGDRVLAAVRLARRSEHADLRIDLPGAPALDELWLEILDGGDAPLRVHGADLEVDAHEVLLAAPAGTYRALLGNPDAAPPRYELGAARELVVGLSAEPAAVGPLVPRPGYRASRPWTRWADGEGLTWGAVVLAVVVLLASTLRLAGRSGPDSRDEA